MSYGSSCDNCYNSWTIQICKNCTHTFKEEIKEEQQASRLDLCILRERINDAIRKIDQKEKRNFIKQKT